MNKPIMVEITSQVLAIASLMAVFRIPTSKKPSPSLFCYKINTLKVPSIYTESISPTMK